MQSSLSIKDGRLSVMLPPNGAAPKNSRIISTIKSPAPHAIQNLAQSAQPEPWQLTYYRYAIYYSPSTESISAHSARSGWGGRSQARTWHRPVFRGAIG